MLSPMCPPSRLRQEVLLGLSMPHKKAFERGGQKGGERAEGDSGDPRVLNLGAPPTPQPCR